MTAIGYVIPVGERIPDDVTGVKDRGDAAWVLTERGHWHMVENVARCHGDDADGYGFMREFDALTVTAVRDEAPDVLVSRRTVQARSEDGLPWWIHGCGSVWPTLKAEGLCDDCGTSGPWLPLLVGGDPAPERCTAISGLHGTRCIYLVQDERHEANDDDRTRHEDENEFAWITVRGRDCAPEVTESGAAYWERRFNEEADRGDQAAQQILTLHRERAEALGILGPVMEALGVDRPEDVLRALNVLKMAQQHGVVARTHIEAERDKARAELKHHLDSLDRLAGELNEARDDLAAEQEGRRQDGERLRARIHEAVNEANARGAKTQSALAKLSALMHEARDRHGEEMARSGLKPYHHISGFGQATAAAIMQERDEARAEAARLKSDLINANEALGAIGAAEALAQPDPLVLRLPEVPEGTVALVTEDGDRFAGHGHQGGHSWWHSTRSGTMSLARLLSEVGPVRVELAPPREPRTAAGVWVSLHPDERSDLRRDEFAILADALDREAGL